MAGFVLLEVLGPILGVRRGKAGKVSFFESRAPRLKRDNLFIETNPGSRVPPSWESQLRRQMSIPASVREGQSLERTHLLCYAKACLSPNQLTNYCIPSNGKHYHHWRSHLGIQIISISLRPLGDVHHFSARRSVCCPWTGRLSSASLANIVGDS